MNKHGFESLDTTKQLETICDGGGCDGDDSYLEAFIARMKDETGDGVSESLLDSLRDVDVLATFGHGEICTDIPYINPLDSNRTIVHLNEAGCVSYTSASDAFELLFKSAKVNEKHRIWLENPSIFKTCSETWVNKCIVTMDPDCRISNKGTLEELRSISNLQDIYKVKLNITLPGMTTTAMTGLPLSYFKSPDLDAFYKKSKSDPGSIGNLSGIWNIDKISSRLFATSINSHITIPKIINNFGDSSYPTASQVQEVIKSIAMKYPIDHSQMRALESELVRQYKMNYDIGTNKHKKSVIYQLVCRAEVSEKGTPRQLRLVRERSNEKQGKVSAYAAEILSKSLKLASMNKDISQEQMVSLERTFDDILNWKAAMWQKTRTEGGGGNTSVAAADDGSSILANNPEAKMDNGLDTKKALPSMTAAPYDEEDLYDGGGSRKRNITKRRKSKRTKRRLRKLHSKKR
jgi:hypothetical protein